MPYYYTLDELAAYVERRRQEEEHTLAEAARLVNERRPDGESEVHRSNVHKALKGDKKSKYRKVLGELVAVYTPEVDKGLGQAYYEYDVELE